VTCAIFALFAASLNRLTFCCGVSFFGAGSANWRVVARPPGRVCAHTPVAVKRVDSFGDLDMTSDKYPRLVIVVGRTRCGGGKWNDRQKFRSTRVHDAVNSAHGGKTFVQLSCLPTPQRPTSRYASQDTEYSLEYLPSSPAGMRSAQSHWHSRALSHHSPERGANTTYAMYRSCRKCQDTFREHFS
jgi:hypothetical protein